MSTLLDAPTTLDAPTVDRIFRDGRTAYRFTDEPVSETEIARIAGLIENLPTALNTQPLRVVLVRSDAAKARLLPLLNEGNRPKSHSAPIVAILAADIDFHDEMPDSVRDRFTDEAQREQVARFNASLQAGYFVLAVRAVGLDAGPMGGFDKAAVDDEFFPDGRHRSFLVVNVGHVADDGTQPRRTRLAADKVLSVA